MQLGLFAATVFTGATLLFWIQPLFAKMVLPVLGGSSAVWNNATVLFQAALLGGYAYAPLLVRVLKPRCPGARASGLSRHRGRGPAHPTRRRLTAGRRRPPDVVVARRTQESVFSYGKTRRTLTSKRVDFANARARVERTLRGLRFESSDLWYGSAMQHSTPTGSEAGVATAPPRARPDQGQRPPLSVVHARALYRPVPPLDFDDDGYPFGDSSHVESQRHFDARAHFVAALRARFADRDDVFAAADMGLYFERGNRRALVVPDAMVVFGIGEHPDLSYKLWEHRKVPDLVLEVLSKYTWRKDVYEKPPLYAALGVREYWIFDPLRQRRDGGGPLEGWRQEGDGVWRPIAVSGTGDGFASEVLGLEMLADGKALRLREPGADAVLPDFAEASRLRAQAAARADEEAARADEEAVRADQESARADQESARADEEAARAKAAERRVAELEDRLRRTQGS